MFRVHRCWAKDLLVDVRRIELAPLGLFGNAPHGVHDFNAAAVAQRHDQRQAVVFGKGRDGFLEMFLHVFRQAVNLPDDFQPHVVFVQLRRFGLEIVDEIFHQRIHFVLGAVPILGGKSVEREIFDAEFARRANDRPRRFRALPMTLDARQAALLRPAAVAVHDDGDMLRQRRLGFGAQMWSGTHLSADYADYADFKTIKICVNQKRVGRDGVSPSPIWVADTATLPFKQKSSGRGSGRRRQWPVSRRSIRQSPSNKRAPLAGKCFHVRALSVGVRQPSNSTYTGLHSASVCASFGTKS